MFTESFLTVNGCKIRLHRGGQGAPLLYLHGINGAGSVQPFMELLAAKYDVLVPEHPGFGVFDASATMRSESALIKPMSCS